MVKLLWLQSAKDDLKDIYDFIAADSIKYARFQIKQIRARTKILKTNPYAGKIVQEFDVKEIKEIVVSHYRIIYRVFSEKEIHILLIHHGARKFPRVI